MKELFKLVCATTALLGVGLVSAETSDASVSTETDTSVEEDVILSLVGADFEFTRLRGKNNWGKVLQSNYPGANFYLGGRFFEYFGLIVGYDVTTRRAGSHTFQAGETFFGVAAAPGSTLTERVRAESWYLDLMGYIPFCNSFDLIGTIGYGAMWAKVSQTITGPFAVPALTRSTRYAGGLRAGVGLQFMMTKVLGIRGMVNWKQTSEIRLVPKGGSFFSSSMAKPFRDAYSFRLGLFLAF